MFSKPEKTDVFCFHLLAPQNKWLNESPLFGTDNVTQMLLKHSTGLDCTWCLQEHLEGVCRAFEALHLAFHRNAPKHSDAAVERGLV